jgi:hypothetical protein
MWIHQLIILIIGPWERWEASCLLVAAWTWERFGQLQGLLYYVLLPFHIFMDEFTKYRYLLKLQSSFTRLSEINVIILWFWFHKKSCLTKHTTISPFRKQHTPYSFKMVMQCLTSTKKCHFSRTSFYFRNIYITQTIISFQQNLTLFIFETSYKHTQHHLIIVTNQPNQTQHHHYTNTSSLPSYHQLF